MVYHCPFVALSKQLRNVDSLRCKLSGSLMGLNVCQLGVFFFCLFCACRWLVSQWHVPRVKKFSAIRPMRQFVFFLNKFLRLCKAESFLLFALSFFSFVPGRNARSATLLTTGAGSPPSAVSPFRLGGLFSSAILSMRLRKKQNMTLWLECLDLGQRCQQCHGQSVRLSRVTHGETDPSGISTLIKKCWFG